MAKALDGKDYQLVITGHSLGAGTAALIGLKLKDRFPGGSLHCNATHISANYHGCLMMGGAVFLENLRKVRIHTYVIMVATSHAGAGQSCHLGLRRLCYVQN